MSVDGLASPDYLKKNKMKPWWETVSTCLSSAIVTISIYLVLGSSGFDVKCVESDFVANNKSASRFSGFEIDYVNERCYETQKYLQVRIMRALNVGFAVFLSINFWGWEIYPKVINAIRTYKAAINLVEKSDVKKAEKEFDKLGTTKTASVFICRNIFNSILTLLYMGYCAYFTWEIVHSNGEFKCDATFHGVTFMCILTNSHTVGVILASNGFLSLSLFIILLVGCACTSACCDGCCKVCNCDWCNQCGYCLQVEHDKKFLEKIYLGSGGNKEWILKDYRPDPQRVEPGPNNPDAVAENPV